jgi:hypothetical protein
MGPSPIPDKLKQPTALEWERYRYEANVTARIIVPRDVSGLVGIRRWRLHPGMYIASAYRNRRYSSSVIWADRPPTARNSGGIYAYQPPAMSYLSEGPVIREGVIGIVELTGQVVIHQDGTLRGERCRILMFVAHPEFASRLSRIYGVPAVAANCDAEARVRIASWLCSREGVMLLKWNVDLISDMQAKKLLSQVDSLRDDGQDAAPAGDVPERLKDRGQVIRDGTEAKRACSDCFTLIVRNASLGQASPAGWKTFANTYACVSNGTISVLQARSPASLNGPLAELLANGLSREEDYVLVEPMCSRCRAINPKRKGVPRSTALHVDWLRMGIGWLNANVEGRYYWRERVRPARAVSKPQAKRKRGITEWISNILHGQ